MLYSEFIKGTNCKDNAHNLQVYKRLEIIYMNDDTVSKADIYEYGKKLVDNSPMDAKKIKKYMTEFISEEDAKNKEQLDADLFTDTVSGELTQQEADFLRDAYEII